MERNSIIIVIGYSADVSPQAAGHPAAFFYMAKWCILPDIKCSVHQRLELNHDHARSDARIV